MRYFLLFICILFFSCSHYLYNENLGTVKIKKTYKKPNSDHCYIQGICYDEKGVALENVVFKLYGTNNAAVSNNIGTFQGKFLTGERKVGITSVGYYTFEFDINFTGSDSVVLEVKLIPLPGSIQD